MCSACLCASSNLDLWTLKCDHLTPLPPTHTFLKQPFPTDFKKYPPLHIPSPTRERNFGASDGKLRKPRKSANLLHVDIMRIRAYLRRNVVCLVFDVILVNRFCLPSAFATLSAARQSMAWSLEPHTTAVHAVPL